MIHELKIERKFLDMTIAGLKPYEIRYNDRNFQAEDYIKFREYNNFTYTGNVRFYRIKHVFADERFCKDGYVILTIEPVGMIENDLIGENA